MIWHDIVHAYNTEIVIRGKEQAFWLLVSFLLTFLIVRLVTNLIRLERGPLRNLKIKQKHVHHLVPGIILVLICGYLAIALPFRLGKTVNAVLFGVGAALTLDEFALWLHLEDVYWERKGRRSIDAVIVAIVIGSLVVVGFDFWSDLGHIVQQITHG